MAASCPRCELRVGLNTDVAPRICPRCLSRDGAEIDLGPDGSSTLRAWSEQGCFSFGIASEPGGRYVLELYGELDVAGAKALERELHKAEASDATRIVVDLAGLDFIDASGLRVLHFAHLGSQLDSNRLVVLRGSGEVERAIKLSGYGASLPLADAID